MSITATDLSQVPFDPRSPAGCPVGSECDECGLSKPDLQIHTVQNGMRVACMTMCRACRLAGIISMGSAALVDRSRVHADEHLGLPADLVRGALTVREQSRVDEVFAVPAGPYNRESDALLWLLTGGADRPRSQVVPRDAACWLQAALDDSGVQTGPYERDVASRVAMTLEVADLEVVAGWFRRAAHAAAP